jgi:WD40 repeat protein
MGFKMGFGSSNNNEIRVNDSEPPLDTVSCICWSQFSRDPLFISGSWDGMIRAYSYSVNEYKKLKEFYLGHPVLAIDFADEAIAVAGLASGELIALELSTGSTIQLGMH